MTREYSIVITENVKNESVYGTLISELQAREILKILEFEELEIDILIPKEG